MLLFIPNTHSYPYIVSNVDHFLLPLSIVIDKHSAMRWCPLGLSSVVDFG